MSALISTAHMVVKPKNVDIHTLNLDLPRNVKSNLKDALLPYLKAIAASGFEKWKRRKAFIVGNTGSFSCLIYF